MNKTQGFCLLETTIALAITAALLTFLVALLQCHIIKSKKINEKLKSARNAIVLYKKLANIVRPGCKVNGQKNILTNNDILYVICGNKNTKIYLSSTNTLYQKQDGLQKEQIMPGVYEFKLSYGTLENGNIRYHTKSDNSKIIKADVSLSQTLKTSMEFAL